MTTIKEQDGVLVESGMSDEVVRKQYRLGAGVERKAVDIEDGVFEGHSAGIGNRDRGDDRIVPGAFKKTIQEKVPAGDVKLLNGHKSRSTEDVWGRVVDAEERKLSNEDRAELADRINIDLKETPTHVLWSKFNVSNRQAAQEALKDVNDGILDGLSIGFRTVQVKYVKDDDADEDVDAQLAWLRGNGVREIHELAWWETSLVTWGMNRSARAVPGSVKSVLERAELMEEIRPEDVDEKRVRYVIRSLKKLIGDTESYDGLLDMDVADEVADQVDQALSKAVEADIDEDAKSELETLRNELSDRKSDQETEDEQVTVDEELKDEEAEEKEEVPEEAESSSEAEEITIKVEDGEVVEISGASADVTDTLSQLMGEKTMDDTDTEEVDVPDSEDEETDETSSEEEKDVTSDEDLDDLSESEETPEDQKDDEIAGDADESGHSDERFDELVSETLAALRHKQNEFSIEHFTS